MKNYTLNITKALHKKLEATKRNLKVDYKYTNGGIVLTADAVTFVLLGLATLSYFANLPDIIGQANTRKITDKSQATIVQHIIKVILNNASYTINIYNTTSRLLVNGNDANHVIAKDIPLANDNDMAKGNKRNEQLNSEYNKETCIKCHKKCRTRSTFCETGNHWVHYRCQKLTEQVIHK